MKGLTKKQKEVLDFVSTFTSEHGYSPSYREMQEAFGFSSTASAFKHVKSLTEKGMIEKEEGKKWRALKEKTEFSAKKSEESIPIIGAISKGKKIELFAQVSLLAFPSSLVKKQAISSCYAFLVKDSSFSQSSILEGDILAIELKQKAEDGELVLITHNDLAYIGRFRQEKENIFIDNLCFQEKEVRVRGALLTLLRTFL